MNKIDNFTPSVIEIEPINYCNLKYKMCHVRFMDNVKVNMLNIKYIQDLSTTISGAIFNISAVFEPSIHTDFSKIIQLLVEQNTVIFTTNATKIDDKLLSCLKVSNNIDTIYLSIDSVVKETYEDIRINRKFNLVSENIKKIANITHNTNTNLVINMVLMRSNIENFFSKEVLQVVDHTTL